VFRQLKLLELLVEAVPALLNAGALVVSVRLGELDQLDRSLEGIFGRSFSQRAS
jgi:hypothetical protein